MQSIDFTSILIRHLIAPAWAAWERSPYLRHYRRLKKTQYDSPEVIQERQWKKLEQLLDHAYRTTDPKDLLNIEDPTGPQNHDSISRAIRKSTRVVAAWGGFADKVALDFPRTSVESLCHRAGVPLRCLGRTNSGAPRHPLYVKGTTPLEPFGPFEEATDGD